MSNNPGVAMQKADFLFVGLLEGFEWFDESLQRSLVAAGWERLSRTESMIMTHVQLEIVRPSDIARSLSLTRQAVHQTVSALVKRDIFVLRPDPANARISNVTLTEKGRAMRRDANRIVRSLTDTLAYRIGERQTEALRQAFLLPWGEPMTIGVDESGLMADATRRMSTK